MSKSWIGWMGLVIVCGALKAGAADNSAPVAGVEERSPEFYKEHGNARTIPPRAVRPRVDYQSELGITIDTNALWKRIGTLPSVLSSLTGDEKETLAGLSRILDGARDYLKDYDAFVRAYEARGANLTADQLKTQLEPLINKQAETGTKVVTALRDYVRTKVDRENPGKGAAEKTALRNVYVRRFLVGKPVEFPALAEFIAEERGAVIARATKDAEQVRGAGAMYLRMRSTYFEPGKPAVRLHIDNYDTVKDENVTQEPRVSFKMSEEDRQRIAAQNKFNTEAAQFIKDVQDRKSRIRESLDQVLGGVRADVKHWKEEAQKISALLADFDQLLTAIGKAESALPAGDELKAMLADAKTVLTEANAAVKSVRDVVAQLTGTVNPDQDPADALFQVANGLFGGLTDSLVRIEKIQKSAIDALLKLQQALDKLKTAAETKPDIGDLVNILKKASPNTTTAFVNLLGTMTQEYPALVAALKVATQKAAQLDSNLPPIQDDPSLLDVGTLAPPPGKIFLARNIARGGVILTLEADLVTRTNANSPATDVVSVHDQEFKVEKFGVINTWSANLIFVKRLGNLGPGERKVQFTPAPSISWTLHYNPPPESKMDKGSWRFIDPGVGINVSALTFRDNGVQVGVGAHFTLFHDLLIGGAGYNLNESYHGTYVFLGLSIFEGLSQMGVNVPVGR